MQVPHVSVLAVGAWMKNCACLLLNGQAHWSDLHGDLNNAASCLALRASLERLSSEADLAGFPVQAFAHDLHPDFFSTQLALTMAAQRGVPAIAVQHHHAHLASVVAYHGIVEPVLGLALDGVGLGLDGTSWGGELLCLEGAEFERLGYMLPLALPGGDRAAKEPWRMAASVLHALGRGEEIAPRFAGVVGEGLATGIQEMLKKGLNCPMSSSAGRWFDAAAAALSLNYRQHEPAQAAVTLEKAAGRALAKNPDLRSPPGAVLHSDGRMDLLAVLARFFDTPDHDEAAAEFHVAMVQLFKHALLRAARARKIQNIALSGGCFMNRILSDRLVAGLEDEGLRVYQAGPQGCSDAGLAIGQAWIVQRQIQSIPSMTQLKETASCV